MIPSTLQAMWFFQFFEVIVKKPIDKLNLILEKFEQLQKNKNKHFTNTIDMSFLFIYYFYFFEEIF